MIGVFNATDFSRPNGKIFRTGVVYYQNGTSKSGIFDGLEIAIETPVVVQFSAENHFMSMGTGLENGIKVRHRNGRFGEHNADNKLHGRGI